MEIPTIFRRVKIAAAGAALLAAMACAYQAHSTREVTVRYGDLNLSVESDARVLYRRISDAARAVCGYEGRSLGEQSDWESCYQLSVSDAVESVHNALLSALNSSSGTGAHRNTALGGALH